MKRNHVRDLCIYLAYREGVRVPALCAALGLTQPAVNAAVRRVAAERGETVTPHPPCSPDPEIRRRVAAAGGRATRGHVGLSSEQAREYGRRGAAARRRHGG